MIQFYVPFAEINRQTFDAAPVDTLFLDVSDGPDAYWRALRDIWAKGETFAIIEHDVIYREGIREELEACPEPWCLYGYDNMCHEACREAWANALGLTRFRKEVIEACPDALTSIPEGRRSWHNVCDEIAGNKIAGVDQPTLRPGSLREAGFTHHWHGPAVGHHPWFVNR